MTDASPERVTQDNTPAPPADRNYPTLLTWIAAILVPILMVLVILQTGYQASGDARRHIAVALSGKSYQDVLITVPGYTMSHSPGWEWLLHMTHRATGWTQDGLMCLSIALSMLSVLLIPLIWIRRPEAWLAAILAILVAMPAYMARLTQARPLLITEAVLIGILFAWTRSPIEGRLTRLIAWTSAGIAASVWIHGAWYLWALLPMAFILAGWWRAALLQSACVGLGIVGGALLTGHPVQFLQQAVLMASNAVSENLPNWMLVPELRPTDGNYLGLVLLGLVYLARRQQGGPQPPLLKDPVACLVILCWILGFKADRFWSDWGIPAALVWVAVQFQEALAHSRSIISWRRAVACGLLGLPLLLYTGNLARTFTGILAGEEILDGSKSDLKGWVPEPGRIFYSAEMNFFYNTFFTNPHGDWNYILGMEPGLMPEEDRRIFRTIQFSRNEFTTYEPWIRKMQPGDRLALRSRMQPPLPQLEWKHVAGELWIGRPK